MRPRHTVGVRSYQPGAKDTHGNPAPTWSAPVNADVYGIYPRFSEEPDARRDESVIGLMILAPATFYVDPRDRVVVDGVEYEVDGPLSDWNRGPFDYTPGVAVRLKRVEG